MKGVMSFLEKAGLVSLEPEAVGSANPPPGESPSASSEPAAEIPAPGGQATAASPAAAPMPGGSLDLAQIYASAGVPASVYPAERLLRVLDGLAAMDVHTRHLTIRAIDEADESWTIDDPVRDAAAKIAALDQHRAQIETALKEVESQTAARAEASRNKLDQVVGEVRRQMAELDALIQREQARAAQEQATLEANLNLARELTARELAELEQQRTRLSTLTSQFGQPTKDH